MKNFSALGLTAFFFFGLNSCVRNSNSSGIKGTPAASYLSGLPLRFIENVGQTLPEVQYHVEGAGHTVLFKSNQIVFKRSNGPKSSLNSNEISMEFVGSNPDISIKGLRKQKGHTNFYSGSNPADW